MSYVANRNAIEETRINKKHAIFITRYSIKNQLNRYAVIEVSAFIYRTYKEINGKWERCEDLQNFLMWNGDFQGYDDISSLIIE